MARNKFWYLCFLVLVGITRAHGDAALLVEEPYGHFGGLNPTGHAAIYFTRICAESPTVLRRCRPGEMGAVISRYDKVAGRDWLAIPLVPYLYAVAEAGDIPTSADAKSVALLRDNYRRQYLRGLAPDEPGREIPGGQWTELIGAAYNRKIYGFQIETSEEQDDAFIQHVNSGKNVAHFNLLFRNCADFSRGVLNFYYRGSAHRNFIADAGITTPKQLARSLVKYRRHHRELHFSAFIIPQVPGTLPRSHQVDGVAESLVKTKKYLVPLAILHPWITCSFAAAYISDGRFSPAKQARAFDALTETLPTTAGRTGGPALSSTSSSGNTTTGGGPGQLP